MFIIVMGVLAQDLPSGEQFLPTGCVQNSTSVDKIIPQDYTGERRSTASRVGVGVGGMLSIVAAYKS